MGKYFGTDGVRGVAGADLTCELAMKIGRGAAAVLTGSTGHRPRILIGKDTRQSGDMLEAALTAGLCSVGADVESLGVLPTPAVAYLVGKYNADAGIVISASHNPMEFNGIKIFAGTGYKLPDEVENEIEAYIDNQCAGLKLATGDDVGRVTCRTDGIKDYTDHLYESINGDLSGLNVCIDCANGASAAVARQLFPRLGAKCTFIGVEPDGKNINAGVGSTHLDNLEKAVVEGGFDCGIAFDGDAVLFSDEAERVFAADGLDAFNKNEIEARETPLSGGPFKPFLAALQELQSEFPSEDPPIRTALITARGAPAHERVIKTLRHWKIRIDELLFLAGKEKAAFLRSFGADIFFDDSHSNVESARRHVARRRAGPEA